MAMSDPLGRYADPDPQRSDGEQERGQGPGLEAARQRAGGAAARRLHPRLSRREHGRRQERAVDRAQVPQRRAGDPGAAPGLQARPADLSRASRTCRGSTTASGIAILSTPRGVLSDAEARDARVGGESCARCSEHVANRQASRRRAGRRRRSPSTARRSVPGASSAQLGRDPAARGRGRPRGRQGRGPAARRGASARARCGASSRTLVQNMVDGVVRGLHAQARDQRRRLPRGRRRQDPEPAARLQPRHQVRDPGGHQDRLRDARPRSRSAAPTSSGSARSRPRSGRSASPSPTRARA